MAGARGAGLTHTRQGVAELRVRDKLPVVESRHAVQVEAVQADHVAVGALEDQDRAPAETDRHTLSPVGPGRRRRWWDSPSHPAGCHAPPRAAEC